MNRKNITILFIVLQILVLGSFVVRYEMLKYTGTTLYIPLRWYDPTDIFRGDYVNLSYELPYSGSLDSSYKSEKYIIPEMDGKNITKIKSITSVRPDAGIYFQMKNGWSTQSQKYTIESEEWKLLSYVTTYCDGLWKVWDSIRYPSRDTSINALSPSPTDDSLLEVIKDENTTSEYYANWKKGKIQNVGECSGTYRFQTTATDRWFVREGTGLDLEAKIRKGDMYAEWKVGKNGAVIITGVVGKEEIGK
jgi:uncharacterized membrane-anchored protein